MVLRKGMLRKRTEMHGVQGGNIEAKSLHDTGCHLIADIAVRPLALALMLLVEKSYSETVGSKIVQRTRKQPKRVCQSAPPGQLF